MTARRSFVVLAGLPASGKTTLARRLAPVLGLPVIDKDDFLESDFAARGIGDAGWRRMLSRECDASFQRAALASDGALLVSFWHVPGMAADSGTPSDWVRALPDRVVTVHCRCEPAIAAQRFLGRTRHPGHGDDRRLFDEVEAWLQALDALGRLELGEVVTVDTTREPDVDLVAGAILAALERR